MMNELNTNTNGQWIWLIFEIIKRYLFIDQADFRVHKTPKKIPEENFIF